MWYMWVQISCSMRIDVTTSATQSSAPVRAAGAASTVRESSAGLWARGVLASGRVCPRCIAGVLCDFWLSTADQLAPVTIGFYRIKKSWKSMFVSHAALLTTLNPVCIPERDCNRKSGYMGVPKNTIQSEIAIAKAGSSFITIEKRKSLQLGN